MIAVLLHSLDIVTWFITYIQHVFNFQMLHDKILSACFDLVLWPVYDLLVLAGTQETWFKVPALPLTCADPGQSIHHLHLGFWESDAALPGKMHW